jgi:hypothetical protein
VAFLNAGGNFSNVSACSTWGCNSPNLDPCYVRQTRGGPLSYVQLWRRNPRQLCWAARVASAHQLFSGYTNASSILGSIDSNALYHICGAATWQCDSAQGGPLSLCVSRSASEVHRGYFGSQTAEDLVAFLNPGGPFVNVSVCATPGCNSPAVDPCYLRPAAVIPRVPLALCGGGTLFTSASLPEAPTETLARVNGSSGLTGVWLTSTP